MRVCAGTCACLCGEYMHVWGAMHDKLNRGLQAPLSVFLSGNVVLVVDYTRAATSQEQIWIPWCHSNLFLDLRYFDQPKV